MTEHLSLELLQEISRIKNDSVVLEERESMNGQNYFHVQTINRWLEILFNPVALGVWDLEQWLIASDEGLRESLSDNSGGCD